MKRNVRVIMLYLLLVVVVLAVLATQLNSQKEKPTELTTSKFVSAVKDDRVKSATYHLRDSSISGTYWASEKDKDADKKPKEFTSTYVGNDSLETLMAAHPEVNYNEDASTGSSWWSWLGTLIPILALAGIMIYFLSQRQAGDNRALQFGRSNARLNAPDQSRITFKDVAGVEEAVEELDEIREFLSNPVKFQKMGAKIPRGVLLVGPPGTGKTLLARAVAGEASVPFYSISGSDFVEMFVGVGASRVRDLFKQAKENAPAIIFIDEIDAVGRRRSAGMGGNHEEREQTLNQLLVEMDGFDINDSVIILAATNRSDILDPALLRPGRFDRQVVVDRADMKGREEILRVHARNKPLADDVDLNVLAKRTPGFTGADLANLLNEAALLAARHDKEKITMEELGEAVDRVISGPERRSRIISDKEKRTIAYHEAGHALVGHMLPNSTEEIHKISIIARGQALGYTISLPSEEHFLTSKQEMLDNIALFMGGRVAEEIAIGDITTGASNDIERATKLARQMVTRFGMTDAMGAPQTFGDPSYEDIFGRDTTAVDYSQETANRIDKEVARIMADAHRRATEILVEHRAQLDLIVDVLIERETIDIEAVTALLNDKWDEYLKKEAAAKKAEAERIAEIEKNDPPAGDQPVVTATVEPGVVPQATPGEPPVADKLPKDGGANAEGATHDASPTGTNPPQGDGSSTEDHDG